MVWAIYTRSLGGFGAPTLNVGFSPNPYSPWREYFAGLGLNFNKTHVGVMPTLLYTHTTDGNQLEYWVSPWVDTNRLVVQSFIGGYLPLKKDLPSGYYSVFVDPVSVLYKLKSGGPVAVGATYTGTFVQGVDGYQAAGPSVQFAVPKGVVLIDALKGFSGGYKNEVRVTVLLAF